MHHARKCAVAVFLAQDTGHVVIGVARMDDQGQARIAGHGNMGAQRGLLDVGRFSGVVVIKPGFADAHHLGMTGQRQQVVIAGHGFCCHAHRVGSGGVKHRRVGFGDGAHGGFVFQLGADGDHARDAGLHGAVDHIWQFILKIGKIKVTMAVGNGVNVAHAGPVC